jgi:hypothetical protein
MYVIQHSFICRPRDRTQDCCDFGIIQWAHFLKLEGSSEDGHFLLVSSLARARGILEFLNPQILNSFS